VHILHSKVGYLLQLMQAFPHSPSIAVSVWLIINKKTFALSPSLLIAHICPRLLLQHLGEINIAELLRSQSPPPTMLQAYTAMLLCMSPECQPFNR
jgi:hypothetical protein